MGRIFHDFRLHLDEHEGWLHIHGDGEKLGVGKSTERLPAAQLFDLTELSVPLSKTYARGRGWAAASGETIFRALFGQWPELNSVGRIFAAATNRVEREGSLLRVIIEYDLSINGAGTQGVHEVPWELLFHPGRRRFVVLDEAYLLVRHLRGTGESWRPLRGPRRILLTTACPSGQERLQLKSEQQQILSVLNRPGVARLARWVEAEHVSTGRLRREFNRALNADEPFHIWHHCGHAQSSEGAVRLVLHGEDGVEDAGPDCPDPHHLLEVIEQHQDLRLVILNVCLGGDRFGLAAWLAALKVPATIGYRCQVSDEVALGFADALWRRLPTQPVDLAVRGARRTLAGGDPLEFAKIILFLRSLEDECLLFSGD